MTFMHYPGHLAAVAVVAAVVGLLVWAYFTPSVRKQGFVAPLLFVVNLAVVLFLVVLAWDPARPLVSTEPVPNIVLAIFDTSESMSVKDQGDTSRLQRAVTAFETALGGNSTRLGVEVHGFDAQLYKAGSTSALREWGSQTNVAAPLELVAQLDADPTLRERDRGRVAAIAVFTDGKTPLRNPDAFSALNDGDLDVILVGVGEDSANADWTVNKFIAPARVLTHAPYDVEAQISGHGGAEPATVVLERNGSRLAEQSVNAEEALAGKSVLFSVLADTPGTDALTVKVLPANNEVNLANNERHATVAVTEETKLSVLLYAQWMQPDIGRLREALSRDTKVTVDFALDAVRDLKNSGRISFSASSEKLPETREQLNRYDVIILGGCDPKSMNEAQIDALYSFVVERGGGLILLPGNEVYDLALSRDARLQTLYPGQANPGNWAAGDGAHIDLTPAGTRACIASPALFTELPEGIRPEYAVVCKPAANPLALMGNQAVIVHQRVGRGLVCLLNLRGLYMLYRENENGGALRELMSSLVSEMGAVPRESASIELFAERSIESPAEVRVTARLNDEVFAPVNNARVLLHIGSDVLRMAQRQPGAYETILNQVDAESLLVNAEAEVNGKFFGTKSASFQLPRGATEMTDVAADRVFLRDLAKKLNASYVDVETFDTAALTGIEHTTLRETKRDVVSAWRSWALLSLLCGALTAYWFLRRFRGLI